MTRWRAYFGWEFPGAAGEAKVVNDPQRGPCLRGSFKFTAESRYAGIQWQGELPQASAIGFWVKLARRDRGLVRVRDATGQEHLGGFRAVPGRWTHVQVKLVPDSFGAHWGGANDGRLHFPLQAVLIGVNRGPDEAEMYLSTLYAVVPAVQPSQRWGISVTTEPAMGVAFRGERARWTARVVNRVPEPGRCRLQVQAQAMGRKPRILTDQLVKFSQPSDWSRRAPATIQVSGSLPTDRLQYACLRARVLDDRGEVLASAIGALAVVPRPRHYGRPDPQCYFGLQMGVDFAVAERLGAKAIRSAPGWRWAEPRPGFMRWQDYLDKAVLPALERHMEVLLTLQAIAPGWAAWQVEGKPKLRNLPDPNRLEAYERFVKAVAQRYRGRLAAIEIQNEPDLTCLSHPGLSFEEGVDYYVRLLEAGRRGAKAGDPELPVAGLDVSGGDFDRDLRFTAAVLERAADQLDLFTGHPYASPRYFGPDARALWPIANRMAEKCAAALDLLVKHGRPRRMWIGELGWGLDTSVDPLSRYSLDFAACIARALIVGRSVPGVEKFLYFTMLGCNEQGHEYGLFRGRPPYPLPAAAAYATCAYLLHHARPIELVEAGEGMWRASFHAPERKELVVAWWNAGSSCTLSLPAQAPAGQWLDAFGRRLRPAGGKVQVGRLPVYWALPAARVGLRPRFLANMKAEPDE